MIDKSIDDRIRNIMKGECNDKSMSIMLSMIVVASPLLTELSRIQAMTLCYSDMVYYRDKLNSTIPVFIESSNAILCDTLSDKNQITPLIPLLSKVSNAITQKVDAGDINLIINEIGDEFLSLNPNDRRIFSNICAIRSHISHTVISDILSSVTGYNGTNKNNKFRCLTDDINWGNGSLTVEVSYAPLSLVKDILDLREKLHIGANDMLDTVLEYVREIDIMNDAFSTIRYIFEDINKPVGGWRIPIYSINHNGVVHDMATYHRELLEESNILISANNYIRDIDLEKCYEVEYKNTDGLYINMDVMNTYIDENTCNDIAFESNGGVSATRSVAAIARVNTTLYKCESLLNTNPFINTINTVTSADITKNVFACFEHVDKIVACLNTTDAGVTQQDNIAALIAGDGTMQALMSISDILQNDYYRGMFNEYRHDNTDLLYEVYDLNEWIIDGMFAEDISHFKPTDLEDILKRTMTVATNATIILNKRAEGAGRLDQFINAFLAPYDSEYFILDDMRNTASTYCSEIIVELERLMKKCSEEGPTTENVKGEM